MGFSQEAAGTALAKQEAFREKPSRAGLSVLTYPVGAGGIRLLSEPFQKSDQYKRVGIPFLLLHKPREKDVYPVVLAT